MNVTITVTEIVDGVSAVSTPATITVFDGVFVGGGGSSGAVDSVNGKTGVVVLTASDVSAQPVDSDLTAIAALATTVFGRSLLTAADATAARALTGAGTSSLALGTTSTTAKAGDYQPAAANISDASTIGRTVLTAADAATIRTALGLGTAATTAATAYDAAGAAAAAQAASQPLDSDLTAIAALATTTFGRSLLTAADAAAARTAIGAGTSSFDGAYSSLTGKPTLGTAAAKDVPAAGDASSTQVVYGTDTRLTDARTPSAHASSHASAGSDPITIAESQVTGLTTDLAGKAATVHTHAASDVTSGTVATARLGSGTADSTKFLRGDSTWATPAGGGSGTVTSVTAGDTTITVGGTATDPTVAVNAIAESKVTGLVTDLAAKAPTSRTITAGTGLTGGGDLTADRTLAVSYGTTAGTAAQGNDSRLSDARTPTAHASSHAAAGSDPVALDDSQVSAVAPNDQTGTTYTFVLADKHRLVTSSNASAQTLTVPPSSSVAYPLGTVLSVLQKGAGQITLAQGTGVTLNSAHGLKTSAQWAMVSLTKILTDTWAVSGDTTA